MPFSLLVVLTIFTGIGGIFGIIGAIASKEWKAILALIPFIFFASWLIIGTSYPIEVEEVLTLDPVEFVTTVGGKGQLLVYESGGVLKTININRQLGQAVPVGYKVRVTIYKKGYYYGMYYDNSNNRDPTYTSDSYEIVPK